MDRSPVNGFSFITSDKEPHEFSRDVYLINRSGRETINKSHDNTKLDRSNILEGNGEPPLINLSQSYSVLNEDSVHGRSADFGGTGRLHGVRLDLNIALLVVVLDEVLQVQGVDEFRVLVWHLGVGRGDLFTTHGRTHVLLGNETGTTGEIQPLITRNPLTTTTPPSTAIS